MTLDDLQEANAKMKAIREKHGPPLVGMVMNKKALEWVKTHTVAPTGTVADYAGAEVLLDNRLPDGKIEYCHDAEAWRARMKEQAEHDATK